MSVLELSLLVVMVVMVISPLTVSGTGNETIVINSLGRTFTLGMLYDRRSDRIIPGKTLWSPETLGTGVDKKEYRSSKYEVEMSDSVEDKLEFMEVEAGLKASFLGGLVKVEGSAGYLSDERASSNVARVSVKYHAETHFEQLTMSHLAEGKIEYPAVLDDKEATHVVIGIDYGADAYFIFEKEFQNSSSEREIYGNLSIAVNAIPTIDISGHGKIELNDELKSKVSDLKVKFHGDFVLSTNPTTFEQAVEIYRSLPSLLVGKNATSVPMKIYLYPLKKMDEKKIFATVRDIGKSLINNLGMTVQSLDSCIEEAQDLRQSNAAQHFLFFKEHVDWFLRSLRMYKLEFQSIFSQLLVEIRGGSKQESELADILQQHAASPFDKDKLKNWLSIQREESAVLSSIVSLLDPKVKFCKAYDEYLKYSLTSDQLVTLLIDFPIIPDLFLHNLDRYLRNGTSTPNSVDQRKWYQESSVVNHLLENIELFLQFKEANSNSLLRFLYMATPKPAPTFLGPRQSQEQSPVTTFKAQYYQGVHKREVNISLPSQPRSLQQRILNNRVSLTWDHPARGSEFIGNYTVVVTEKGHRLGQTPVKHVFETHSKQTRFEIVTPDSSMPYDVHVFGECTVGRTASSEILHHNGVEVRLVGGAEICSPRRAHSGRIEVLYSSIWGTVCGEWRDREASVACRMLGFSSGVVGHARDHQGGSGQIWMTGVRCSGSESNLDECDFKLAVEGECNHTMDVVVECYGGESTGDASTPEQCSINELQDQLALSRSNLNLARSNLNQATSNLNLAREELNEERDVRIQDLRSMNETLGMLNTTVSKSFSVAFQALLQFSHPTIRYMGNVKFVLVQLNIGGGYDSSTGVFTVPPGGAGLYYFNVHLTGDDGESSWFHLKRNDDSLCSMYLDANTSGSGDYPTDSCAATVQLNTGDRIYVMNAESTDDTPLYGGYYSGFTGFLMKPA